mmetsp:Transcript_23697/g.76108  ORF Transcript_23697/g.76108 Transcript_23697/m.76108 type:complete len:140 (+) Transcript_23697:3398-3817(+)
MENDLVYNPSAEPLPNMSMPPPEPMTVERAKTILKETIELFSLPENRAKLEAAVQEAANAPPEHQQMLKLQKLLPLITGMAGGKLREYGLPNVMVGVMQLQSVAPMDPLIGEGVKLLTTAASGTPPSDDVVADYLKRLA